MSIAPWSFSKIKSFEQCPKKFYHLKVSKDYKEPETSAMLYGTAVHLRSYPLSTHTVKMCWMYSMQRKVRRYVR